MSGLPDGWFETTIEEVAEIHNVSRIPLSTKQRSKKQGAYPYYGASGIIDYIDEYIFDGEYVLISEDGENLNTRKTPIAFKANGKFWVNNHAHIVKGLDSYLNDYLVYYLKNTNLSPYITGAAQPKLSKSNLLSIPFILPENKNEQKSIANILSSFDEKIELLREQNEILETLAQTIFKEWFVNFNYPDATGEMEGSELGEIPKGWRVGSVGNILILHYGKALKTQNRTGMGFPVYGSNGVVGFHEEYLVKGPGIIVGRKGTMGAVVWCDNDFFPIDTAFYVTDSLEVGDLYFHYFLLKKQDFERLGSDSAVPGLNRNSVYIIDTVIPAKTCIENFSSTIKPLFEKIKNNTSQIQTLTKIRDTLLPKLMSGEVRVN